MSLTPEEEKLVGLYETTGGGSAQRIAALVRRLAALVRRLAGRVSELEEALEMVILYHSGGWWDEAKSKRWERWTGRPEATTRALCDQLRTLRAALQSTAEGAPTITKEEVQEALKRGAKEAMEIGRRIAETFSLPTDQVRLSATHETSERTGGKEEDRIYPCNLCGCLRTKAEGGTVFTVCDDCWDKNPERTCPHQHRNNGKCRECGEFVGMRECTDGKCEHHRERLEVGPDPWSGEGYWECVQCGRRRPRQGAEKGAKDE